MTTIPRKLYIFSGADRVGKSTFIKKLSGQPNLANRVFLAHHKQPDPEKESVLAQFTDSLNFWLDTDKPYALFDRGYPCTWIYEQIREGNSGHLEDIIDLELNLINLLGEKNVTHIGFITPWYSVAARHKEEIFNHLDSPESYRRKRDTYIRRMGEHDQYQSLLELFFNTITAFENVLPDDLFKRQSVYFPF